MPTNLDVTSFDHEELKSSLIAFLQSTQEFGDFDYEGSYINTLVDLLVRNSHYSAYLANFLASESFIDSAQLRSSVVSHATKLSYVPRSRTAARLVTDITVLPDDTTNIPNTIIMDAGSTFLASDGNATYSFVVNEDRTLTFDSNVSGYVVEDVDLYQGQRITNQFVHTAQTTIALPNPNIDTSTMLVEVASAQNLNERDVYRKAETILELGSEEKVFFLSENTNGLPTIEFGKDILGVEPADNSVVYVTFINVEQEHANGATNLVPASTIGGYSNIQTTVVTPAFGGAERETIEDIRFLAPRRYQSQERALATFDYITLVKSEYPFVRSMISWGGEDNDPPAFGKVFMSIISDEGTFLTDTAKDEIVDYLKDYRVGSITPEIVDPDGIGLNIDLQFAYDPRQTGKTFNEIGSAIHQKINDFNENNINQFNKYYNESELIYVIMQTPGVTSINIDTKVYKKLDVLRFDSPIYTYEFKNPIVPGSVSMEGFKIDVNGLSHKLYDDEDGGIWVSYTKLGDTFTTKVGDVDYDTGLIEFIIDMIQDANEVYLYAQPAEENFYVDQNRYVFIDEFSFEPLNTKAR